MPGSVVRDANETDLLSSMSLNAAATETGTSLEIGWAGPAQFLVETGTIDSGTGDEVMAITFQGCETTDFSTDPVVELGFVDLVDTDDDGVFAVQTYINSKFVRAVAVLGGTTPSFVGTTAKIVPMSYLVERGAHPTAAALA